ncbi:hypothetical protein U3516DRAFT_759845 [Neocallimastix sp. 'constans']
MSISMMKMIIFKGQNVYYDGFIFDRSGRVFNEEKISLVQTSYFYEQEKKKYKNFHTSLKIENAESVEDKNIYIHYKIEGGHGQIIYETYLDIYKNEDQFSFISTNGKNVWDNNHAENQNKSQLCKNKLRIETKAIYTSRGNSKYYGLKIDIIQKTTLKDKNNYKYN